MEDQTQMLSRSNHTRDDRPTTGQCRANVPRVGPALTHRWANIYLLLSSAMNAAQAAAVRCCMFMVGAE